MFNKKKELIFSQKKSDQLAPSSVWWPISGLKESTFHSSLAVARGSLLPLCHIRLVWLYIYASDIVVEEFCVLADLCEEWYRKAQHWLMAICLHHIPWSKASLKKWLAPGTCAKESYRHASVFLEEVASTWKMVKLTVPVFSRQLPLLPTGVAFLRACCSL